MFQRPRSPGAAGVLAAAAAGLALAGPATAFATSGHYQAPRHDSDQQNNGHHGPQRRTRRCTRSTWPLAYAA